MNFFNTTIGELAQNILSKSNTNPEFWLFDGGTSKNTINQIKTTISHFPQDLVDLLSVFNGGFASLMGKVDCENPGELEKARELSNCFLSLPEIKTIYGQLNREYQLHHEEKYPLIPFFITKDGDLLAFYSKSTPIEGVEVIDGATIEKEGLSGIYIIEDSYPHSWKKVYPHLIALLHQYVEKQGNLPVRYTDRT